LIASRPLNGATRTKKATTAHKHRRRRQLYADS
jgi:hypothetical protein